MIVKSLALAAVLTTALTPAASAAPAAEPAPDAAFLRAVHEADLAEIAAGTIAQNRGVSARVRAIGAQFVRDHTTIDDRLTATAQAAGVTLPGSPDAAELALLKRYRSVPRARFDAFYLRTQLAAHGGAMQAGEDELAHGRDERVKQLVEFAAPLVEAHHAALMAAMNYGPHGRHR